MYELDAMYSAEYFGSRMSWKSTVYPFIADALLDVFNPSCVADVGCGAGHLAHHLQGRGVRVVGFEGSSAAFAHLKGLNVIKHDLRAPLPDDMLSYELVVSVEVAEHLEEKYAPTFVSNLCRLSDTVLLTASNEQGYSHVNPRPKEYWELLFSEQGYVRDSEKELELVGRLDWSIPTPYDYLYKNLMVFKRE